MPRHSIERDARGRVAGISGSCESDECPIEDVDDDGSIEYRCPESGDVLAEEAAVEDVDVPDDRKPDTTDDLTNQGRRRRGKRHR